MLQAQVGCNYIYNLHVKTSIVNSRYFVTAMSGMAAYREIEVIPSETEYEFDEEDMINRDQVEMKYGRSSFKDMTKELEKTNEKLRLLQYE
jgi:hypothetical protein